MAQLTVPIHIDLPENWLDMVMDKVKQDDDWVVPVRCGECRFFCDEDYFCRRLGLTGAFNKESFCSHGERREE